MSITIKWFPRSWLQITNENHIIYIDPSYLKTYFKHYSSTINNNDDGLPEVLPKGDIILITHSHKDHCKLSTINQLKDEKTIILAPKSCSKELGINYKVVKPNERYNNHNIVIETVHAYNTIDARSTRKVHKKDLGVGYILTFNHIRIYHSGDTDLIPEMKDIKNIDIAFLPIGGTFTMDMDEAIEAVKIIQPKLVIPIHHLNANPHSFDLSLINTDVKVLSIEESFIYK